MGNRIGVAANIAAMGAASAGTFVLVNGLTSANRRPLPSDASLFDRVMQHRTAAAAATSAGLGVGALLTDGNKRKALAGAAIGVALLGIVLPWIKEKVEGFIDGLPDVPPAAPGRADQKDRPDAPKGPDAPPVALPEREQLKLDQQQLAQQIAEAMETNAAARNGRGRAHRPVGDAIPQSVLNLKEQYWASHEKYLDTDGTFGPEGTLWNATYEASTGTLTLSLPSERTEHPASKVPVTLTNTIEVAADNSSVQSIRLQSVGSGDKLDELNEISRDPLGRMTGARNVVDSVTTDTTRVPRAGSYTHEVTTHSETRINAAGQTIASELRERAVTTPSGGGEQTIAERTITSDFDSKGNRQSTHAVTNLTAPNLTSNKVTDTIYNAAGEPVKVTGTEQRELHRTDPGTGWAVVEKDTLSAVAGDGTSAVTERTIPQIDSTRSVSTVNPAGGFDDQHPATIEQVVRATGPADKPVWQPMVETITRMGSGDRRHIETTTYQMAPDGTPIQDVRAYLEAHPELGILVHNRNPNMWKAIEAYTPRKETVLDQRDPGDHFSDFWISSGRTLVAVGGAALVIGGSVATLTGAGAPVGIPLIALGAAGAGAETFSIATNRQGADVFKVLGNVGLMAGGVGFQFAPVAAGAASASSSTAAATITSRLPSSLAAMATRVTQSPLAPLAANTIRYGGYGVGSGVAVGTQTAALADSISNGKDISALQALNYLATLAGTAAGFKWTFPNGVNIPRPTLPTFNSDFARFAPRLQPAPAFVGAGG